MEISGRSQKRTRRTAADPNDTRLNVEKRFGYGGTVNVAHPAGKAIMIIMGIILIGTIVGLVWAAATGHLDSTSIHMP